MITDHFPTPYDVEQALTFHSTSYDSLQQFVQERGIIIGGRGKDAIASFANAVLLDHQDYVKIREIAQGSYDSTNISGFDLHPTQFPVSLNDLRDDLTSLSERLNSQYISTSAQGAKSKKLEIPQIHAGSLVTKLEYERSVPGRVELMQYLATSVDLLIEPSGEADWRVICFPQSPQDVKVVEDLFKKMGNNSYKPFVITLESFSKQQRIQFFDDLLEHYGGHKEWRLGEVVGITVKQIVSDEGRKNSLGTEIDDPDEDENDEKAPEPTPDDLLSIKQAVLDGTNLRTNSFVKKCESQNYYFPAMRLDLDCLDSSEKIRVAIRFKLSPKVFEIVLEAMAIKDDLGSERPTVFLAERQRDILKDFWATSHTIWSNIFQGVPNVGNSKQPSFNDGIRNGVIPR